MRGPDAIPIYYYISKHQATSLNNCSQRHRRELLSLLERTLEEVGAPLFSCVQPLDLNVVRAR